MSRYPPVEIDIELKLTGPQAVTLLKHANRRKRAPVEIMADIIDAVLGDDIVDAVLDDGGA